MTTMTTLYVREGTEFREAEPADILTRAQALISQRYRSGSPVLADPRRTEEFLRLHLGGRDYEVFGVIHLNLRRRLIAAEDLFRGTLDGASVHPREVVRSVIAHGSAEVILYHNHPSGASEPSQADKTLTHRLKAALSLIDVKILDHLIVAEKVFSFSAAGIL
jgi:DNA repair protein RadC